MTRPPGPLPLIDPGNPLFGQAPVRMDAGAITLPDGSTAGVITIRSATTTMTVILGPGELGEWADVIARVSAAAGKKTSLAVPTAAERITLGNGGPVTPGRLGLIRGASTIVSR